MYLSNIHKAIMGELNKGNDKMVTKLRRYEKIATYGAGAEKPRQVVVTNEFTTSHDAEIFKCKVILVDALREFGSGWIWNDLHIIEDDVMVCDDSRILSDSRAFLKWMRDNDFLSDDSKGKVRVEFNMDLHGVLIEVQKKSNGEPIIALSSVH